MKNLCLLLLVVVPLCSFTKVQDSVLLANSKEIQYDLSSDQNMNKFDTTLINDFKKQDDFDYTEYEEVDNAWTRFKRWIAQLWNRAIHWIFGVDKITGFWAVILRILPYLIVIGVLLLLVWLFMRVNPGEILLEKNRAPQIILSEDEDIIQNQNIEQLIAHALQHNNYRLAIRYYYLLVLKKLSETELIEWQAQKTNTDYVTELSGKPIKKQFQKITRIYDFIWYGSFEIEENTYTKAVLEFKTITKAIKT